MTALQRIIQARTNAIYTHPFWACIGLSLKIQERPDIQTLATDGYYLFYNPAFVDSISDRDLHFIVLHEAAHVAFRHPARMLVIRDQHPNVDPEHLHHCANIAADWIVNASLSKDGIPCPPYGLMDLRGQSHGLEPLTAIVLAENPEPAPDQLGDGNPGESDSNGSESGSGDGNESQLDPGKCGGVIAPDEETLTEETGESDPVAARQAFERDLSERAVNADRRAGKAGGESGAGSEIAAGIRQGSIQDWTALLREHMTARIEIVDSTWSRPSRRSESAGEYLPSPLRSDRMGDLLINVDTSGSVDRKLLSCFLDEINAIMDDLRPTETTVVYADTGVRRADTFAEGEPITGDPVGGGGTCFAPVLEYADDQGLTPDLCLWFSDLAAWDMETLTEPPYPVVWVVWPELYGHYEIPFGERVDMPIM